MKEVMVVFIIALVLGSILNSLPAGFWDGNVRTAQTQPGSERTQPGAEQPQAETGIGAPGIVINASDQTFKEEVLKSEKPVFVDFWAPWCGPCRMMGPVVEQLAKQYQGRVKFVKLNTEDNREMSSEYEINAIPAFYVFKGGKVVDKIVGAAPEDALRAVLDKAAPLNSAAAPTSELSQTEQ